MMKKRIVPKKYIPSSTLEKSLALYETKWPKSMHSFWLRQLKTIPFKAARIDCVAHTTEYSQNLAIRCQASISWPQICTTSRGAVAASLTLLLRPLLSPALHGPLRHVLPCRKSQQYFWRYWKKIMSRNKELNFHELLFFNDDCIHNEKNVQE